MSLFKHKDIFSVLSDTVVDISISLCVMSPFILLACESKQSNIQKFSQKSMAKKVMTDDTPLGEYVN